MEEKENDRLFKAWFRYRKLLGSRHKGHNANEDSRANRVQLTS